MWKTLYKKGSARWRTCDGKRKRGNYRKRLTNITPRSSTKTFRPFTDPRRVAAQQRNTPYQQVEYPKPLVRTFQSSPKSAISSLPGSSKCDSSEANTWEIRPAFSPRRSYNSYQTDLLKGFSCCWRYSCRDTQVGWNIHVQETQSALQEFLARRSSTSGLQRFLQNTLLQMQWKPTERYLSFGGNVPTRIVLNRMI